MPTHNTGVSTNGLVHDAGDIGVRMEAPGFQFIYYVSINEEGEFQYHVYEFSPPLDEKVITILSRVNLQENLCNNYI